MKNQLFALIGLGLLLATASAYAQTGVVKANVPFNFIVDKTRISRWAIRDPAYRHHELRRHDHREPGRENHKGFLAERLRIDTGAGDDQAGFPPLRRPVFPGPDLDRGK